MNMVYDSTKEASNSSNGFNNEFTSAVNDAYNGFDSRYYVNPDIDPWIYIISVMIMSVVGCLALFGNISIIIGYNRNRSLHNEFNRMLLNLILAELVSSAYGIPIDITAALQNGWKLGKSVCTATGAILTLSGMISIYTITALSIQRWWIMLSNSGNEEDCHRLFLRGIAKRISSYVMITIIWIIGFAITLPPLFGWSYYAPEDNGISCAPAWNDSDGSSYIISLLLVGWIVPNAIIFGSSVEVMRYQRKNSNIFVGRIAEMKAKREKRLTRMVIIMVLAFNASWTPYAIVCTLKLFNKNFISPSWTIPGLLLAKSANCWNPIIYIFLNTQFRKEIMPRKLLRFFMDENDSGQENIQLSKSGINRNSQTDSKVTTLAVTFEQNTTKTATGRIDRINGCTVNGTNSI